MTSVVVLLSIMTTSCVQYSAGYSSGAPAAACSTLLPSHDTLAQPVDTNPYQLDIEQLQASNGVHQYVPGVTYTGTSCMHVLAMC